MTDHPIIPLRELPPGQRVGQFEIIRLLNRGGQAHIYLARVPFDGGLPIATLEETLRRRMRADALRAFITDQRICALKIPFVDFADHLTDEYEYLRRASDPPPALVRLYTPPVDRTRHTREIPGPPAARFADANGAMHQLPYLPLEYSAGGSLKDLLRAGQPLPPGAAVAIALQVGYALSYLHGVLNLVHHDVSPSNIVFRTPLDPTEPRAPECVLIDLAVAYHPARPTQRFRFGKEKYLPPESNTVAGGRFDYVVDTFSLGVVLLEMLHGTLPSTTDAVRQQRPRYVPVAPLLPQCSPALCDIIDAMLQPDPARRPAMATVVQRLGGTPEAQQPASLVRPDGVPAASTSPVINRVLLIAAGIVAGLTGLVACGVLAILLIGSTPAEPATTAVVPRSTIVQPTSTLAPVR